MMATALNQLTGMPNLPITRGVMGNMPAAPKGYIGPKEIAPAQEELTGAIGAAEEKVGQADIAIKKAEREEKARELEAKGESLAQYVKDVEAMPERAALKADREALKGMEFVPTRDTVQDIAGLFSLIGVIGMVTGKGNAMQAMNAMNGMMEGHKKGRQDLFKQEQAVFEKNFKAMQAKVQQSLAEYQEALELKKTDREAGEIAKQVALARMESPLLKAMQDKFGDVRVVNNLKSIKNAMDEAVKLTNDLQSKAEDRLFKQRQLEQQERLRKDSLSGKAQLFQGDDGNMYAFDPVTKTTSRVDTGGVKLTRPSGGAAGAGAAAGQIERMMNSMTQVTGAVRSVADLPVSTTAPVFGQKDFKGIFLAPLSALNQTMSKETSQMLQGRMIGVARNLASLETGGAATGLAGLTESIEKGISIPAGAKLHVALDRLAEMRRIVEDSARAALASSKYTEDQKTLIRENLAIVERAIPFTLEDVRDATVAAKGKSPKVPKEDQSLSFTDYINKYGLSKSESKTSESELTPEEQAELEELRAKHGRR